MKAADIMTRAVITTTTDTQLVDVVRTMIRHRISGIPVLDASGAVVGIITEGDLLHRAETRTEKQHSRLAGLLLAPGHLADEYARSHGRNVGEVMSQEVVSVAPETPLAEIVALMESRRIKRLPVLENRKLVGIVSRADLLRALVELLPKAPAAGVSDAEIRRLILAEIDRQSWAPRTTVDVMVEEGMAELRGLIVDERERQALRVLAENTPGVKGVRDRLAWIEPISGMMIDVPSERVKQ
jgi:CBS domain-containing protein